ncbi:MAG: methionyl-tRNA formyltransferase [Gammaproteobacteria bacterium]
MRLVFAGTPDFAAVSLNALIARGHEIAAVYTQPDRPAGRGRHETMGAVKRLALAHDLPLRQPATLRGADAAVALRELAAETMVVAAYGLILPAAILEVPPRGCNNVHASLLPRWRGAAPIQRALLAGDAETGITIMRMRETLDTGPMFRQERLAIGPHDTGGTVHDRLASLGAELLIEVLDALQAGTAVAVEQDDARATYAPKIAKAEAEVDWSRPALEIERKVRAFNPVPVAHATVGGLALRLWDAVAVDAVPGSAPGTVIGAGAGGIDIAAGEGALRITRLQVPGRRPIGARDFLNAHAALLGLAAR